MVLQPSVRSLENSSELAVASIREVLIVVWRSPMTLERIRRIDTYNERMQSEHARFFALVLVENHSNSSPDTATREATAQLTAKYEHCCAGVALVLDGTGIKQTVIRLAIMTIQLISTQRVPQQVFDRVDAASGWIADQLPERNAGELTRAVEAVRAQPAS